MKRTAVMLLVLMLISGLAVGTALAAARPVPAKDDAALKIDTPNGLPGDHEALKQALAESAPVRYRILVVDDVQGESREAYLDRVLAQWGWPEADQLQLVIFAEANYDLYFAMGANFTRAGVDVKAMLDLIHGVYQTEKRKGDPSAALAAFIRTVNAKMEPNAAVKSPEQVVRAYYAWHTGSQGSPLGSRAYRTSPYLTQNMVIYVDDLLAGWDKNGGGGADPFLCAQNIPAEMTYEAGSTQGDAATVFAYTHWATGKKQLTVNLKQVAGQWLIDHVQCQK